MASPGDAADHRLGRVTLFASILIWGLVAGCSTRTGPDAEELVGEGEVLFQSEGCVNCHGEDGRGIIGPALRDGAVLATFPSCSDQLRWVSLGSARWSRDVGSTYGAFSKPVRGGMPSFGRRLTEDQIVRVVSFTRVVFGGADAEEVAADCMGDG